MTDLDRVVVPAQQLQSWAQYRTHGPPPSGLPALPERASNPASGRHAVHSACGADPPAGTPLPGIGIWARAAPTEIGAALVVDERWVLRPCRECG
jgi:hypothetical protein